MSIQQTFFRGLRRNSPDGHWGNDEKLMNYVNKTERRESYSIRRPAPHGKYSNINSKRDSGERAIDGGFSWSGTGRGKLLFNPRTLSSYYAHMATIRLSILAVDANWKTSLQKYCLDINWIKGGMAGVSARFVFGILSLHFILWNSGKIAPAQKIRPLQFCAIKSYFALCWRVLSIRINCFMTFF